MRGTRKLRLRGRPALPADPGRIHGRRRHHHDHRPAGEDQRRPCRWRHLLRRSRFLRPRPRRHPHWDAGARPGQPALPVRRPVAVPAAARTVARRAPRSCGCGGIRSGKRRHRGGRKHSRRPADAGPATAERALGPAAARHGRPCRRLHRQRADRPGVRHAPRLPRGPQPGTARPRRGERRIRFPARLSGEQQRQPDGDRQRVRQPDATPLADRRGHCGRRPVVRALAARPIPSGRARRHRHLCRRPPRGHRGFPAPCRVPPQRVVAGHRGVRRRADARHSLRRPHGGRTVRRRVAHAGGPATRRNLGAGARRRRDARHRRLPGGADDPWTGGLPLRLAAVLRQCPGLQATGTGVGRRRRRRRRLVRPQR